MKPGQLAERVTLIILITLLSGCARHYVRIEDCPLPETHELVTKIARNYNSLEDFEGFGNIIYKSSSRRQAWGIKAQFHIPDYYRISLYGTLGVSVGTLILAEDEYGIISNSYSAPIAGQIEDIDLQEEFGLPVDVADIPDLLHPLKLLPEVSDTIILERDLEEQSYVISMPYDNYTEKFWIDPFYPNVTRYLRISISTDTICYRELDGIRKRANVFIPTSWVVQLGSGEEAFIFNVRLSSIWVNRGIPESNFKIKNLN